ncbi:hypothetical protein J4558_00025 [Leptolyngbya sp. 15MV]|nr:hypothetical protein J4558_00025 [Leptolyngbya sp. 15MV]
MRNRLTRAAEAARNTWLAGTWGDEAPRVVAAYRAILRTAAGQRMLADLEAMAEMGQTPFSPADPHLTAFRAGKQAVVMHLRAMIGETHETEPVSTGPAIIPPADIPET